MTSLYRICATSTGVTGLDVSAALTGGTVATTACTGTVSYVAVPARDTTLPGAADALLAYTAGLACVVLPWVIAWVAQTAARTIRLITAT